MPAIWALWPQLCAAPVCRSASGWSEVRRLSSSPTIATRGPGRAPFEAALNAGQREAGRRLETQRRHALGNEHRSAPLVEAGFRVAHDRIAERDDLVAVAVDRGAHRRLQFVLAGHRRLRSVSRPMIQACGAGESRST